MLADMAQKRQSIIKNRNLIPLVEQSFLHDLSEFVIVVYNSNTLLILEHHQGTILYIPPGGAERCLKFARLTRSVLRYRTSYT